MAEILVCAQDRPVPDSPGRWYRGMPVIARPDGWEWGRKERPPRFVVIEVPETVAEVESFLEGDVEIDRSGNRPVRKTFARRKRVVWEDALRAAEEKGGRHRAPTVQGLMRRFPRNTRRRKPTLHQEPD